MSASRSIDSEDLWKRIGLDELRKALAEIELLTGQFVHALQALPPCTKCARAKLISQIGDTGTRLGSKTISLSVLANTLERAVGTAEHTQEELLANAPEPCQCATGSCTCHE